MSKQHLTLRENRVEYWCAGFLLLFLLSASSHYQNIITPKHSQQHFLNLILITAINNSDKVTVKKSSVKVEEKNYSFTFIRF